ncbi:MAG: diguanylate cyclase [Candidatus Velthaea sp.]
MTARGVFSWLRASSLIFALGLLALTTAPEARHLRAGDVFMLAGAAVLAFVLSLLRAPVAYFERADRPPPTAERIGLMLPLLAAVFAMYGWYEAALVDLFAHVALPSGARRRGALARMLNAALRVPMWWMIAPLHHILAVHSAALSGAALGAFVVINAAWYLAANLLWVDPLAALRANRSVLWYWYAHVRTPGWLPVTAAEFAWGYLAFQVLRHDGPALALAVLSAPVLMAAVLVQLARTRALVHRLTLSREAIEAMLSAHDPLPQIRSILESVDVRVTRESIEVFGFGRGGDGDGWGSVARLGPAAPETLTRSAARALYDLCAHGGSVEGVRDADGVVLAYAAHDEARRLLGALVVYRVDGTAPIVSAREFERAARELSPVLADYGAIAATRTAASVDTLTGLVNRRAVGRAADEAIAHVRSGGNYAMLLMDIDHFKTINDLLGHTAGDRALARIGAIISENVREGDVAGRFGGEEFIVLMRDADRERALAVAERLRLAIEQSGLAYADGAPMTISVGVSYARRSDATSEALIDRADRALYRAKNAGRNRVVEAPLVAV